MKSRCFHRTESCLFRFFFPSCFYSAWIKLCLLYLSRAFVKSLDVLYLECKSRSLILSQTHWTLQTSMKYQTSWTALVLCSSSVPVDYLDLSVNFQEHSGSVGSTQLWFQSKTHHWLTNRSKKRLFRPSKVTFNFGSS